MPSFACRRFELFAAFTGLAATGSVAPGRAAAAATGTALIREVAIEVHDAIVIRAGRGAIRAVLPRAAPALARLVACATSTAAAAASAGAAAATTAAAAATATAASALAEVAAAAGVAALGIGAAVR